MWTHARPVRRTGWRNVTPATSSTRAPAQSDRNRPRAPQPPSPAGSGTARHGHGRWRSAQGDGEHEGPRPPGLQVPPPPHLMIVTCDKPSSAAGSRLDQRDTEPGRWRLQRRHFQSISQRLHSRSQQTRQHSSLIVAATRVLISDFSSEGSRGTTRVDLPGVPTQPCEVWVMRAAQGFVTGRNWRPWP